VYTSLVAPGAMANCVGMTSRGLCSAFCTFIMLCPWGANGVAHTEVDKAGAKPAEKMAGGCTSILVAKGGAAGGATMTSQTNDCFNCDFRISRVPAKTHAPGSLRALWAGREAYPRYIGTDRGETYFPERVDTSVYPWKAGEGLDHTVMATVPEVEATYAYLDGSYGIMNEWGLSMGESTCGSLLTAASVAMGGTAKMDIRELGRIAMERCKSAKCAVDLMGRLAITHGYFGSDTTQSEGGESLQIADPEEAWVFHVMADDTGSSAIWVAKRVPDGHMTAVDNQFTIRRIVLQDPDNFRYSENIHAVAARAGLWSHAKDGYPLDFTATFALSRGFMSGYATRRMWRAFTLAAPSLKDTLPADTTVFADDYPWSVPVDKPLTVADVTSMLRDHYEGTLFDMTKGIAAGPYGDPSRFDPGSTRDVYPADEALSNSETWSGHFERAMSVYRCAYSFVSQTRASAAGLDLIWFGQYAPHASQYVPVYVNAEEVPDAFTRGTLYNYDDAASYWNHATVGNWADRFYRFVIGDIKALQDEQEGRLYKAQPHVEASAAKLLASGDRPAAAKVLAKHSAEASASDVAVWRKFFHHIIAKYKDGQRLDNIHEQYTLNPTLLFYPRSWLEAAGFWKLKGVVDQVEPPYVPSALASKLSTQADTATSTSLMSHVAVAIFAATLGLAIGRQWGPTTIARDQGAIITPLLA